jgi:hypothetical protein
MYNLKLTHFLGKTGYLLQKRLNIDIIMRAGRFFVKLTGVVVVNG